MISTAAKRDPRALFDQLMSIPKGEFENHGKDSALQSLLNAVGANNPELALELINKLPESGFKAANWSEAQSALIMAGGSFEALPAASTAQWYDTIRSTVAKIGEKDLSTATAAIERIPGERARTRLYEEIAQKNAKASPKATLEWAQRISDPLAQDAAIRVSFRTWLATDPGEAMSYAITSDASGNPLLQQFAKRQLLNLSLTGNAEEQEQLTRQLGQLSGAQRATIKSAVAAAFENSVAQKVSNLFQ